MLLINRKHGEKIIIYNTYRTKRICITLFKAKSNSHVVVGIDAPSSYTIVREEIDNKEFPENKARSFKKKEY